jgi:Bacterial dnaA protein helix-turn-helix
MSKRITPSYRGRIVQLTLRGRSPRALLQSEDDWHILGAIVARTLFWCGGHIYGCRCEATEMRFALQVAQAPVGAMAQHLAAAYASHLRQHRGWHGCIFKHYIAAPLHDEVFLDDLIMWLHRPAPSLHQGRVRNPVFTADAAYLHPHGSAWITTDRVLQSLSIGAPGSAAYRRRKAQRIPPDIIDLLTRRSPRRKRPTAPAKHPDHPSHEPSAEFNAPPRETIAPGPNVETIALAVADHCRVSLADMRSKSRRRAISQARAITAVLCTRHGASAAAAARLFNRSRSAVIEQAEHYRESQPQIFAAAEEALEGVFASRPP